jgi:CoA-dependent NAD(P)H sulfur oxidoreductase
MRFVIIGGDAAGMSAASRCKRAVPDTDVVVLEQTSDVSYSACGMPYNLADPARDMDDLIVRRAEVFREKQDIDLRLGHCVKAIHRENKTVTGRTSLGHNFELHYDVLLIATGARPIIPGIPGADLPGVLALKSLEDGRKMKSYIAERKAESALIIGTGYIGLEMAEALHELGIRIEMSKPSSRVVKWMPEEMGLVVKEELEEKGVRLRLGVETERIDRTDDRLKVTFSKGDETTVDMVIMAVGIKPNSEAAEKAGLELGPGRAIAVDKFLRTTDPDIYAAGDCADAFNVITGERVWVPLALRANRAGWAVADNVTGKNVELPGIVGTGVFKVLDLEVARTGLSMVEATRSGLDPVENYIKSRSRAHAHPGNQTIHINMIGDAKTGRLLGAQMVGKEGVVHRINSVAVALHAGMTVSEFAQCDMAYAPPFSPVWDPLLTAGNQLLKKIH